MRAENGPRLRVSIHIAYIAIACAVYSPHVASAQQFPQPEGHEYKIGHAVWLDIKANDLFPPDTSCLDSARTAVDSMPGPIQSARFFFNEITSVQTLYSALDVRASGRFGVGFFGSLKASAEYTHTSFYTATRMTALVKIEVKRRIATVMKAALSSDYNTSRNDFHDLCGDGYVSEQLSGSSFAALIVADFESSGAKERFASSLSFTGGAGSADASVLNEALKFNSSSNRRIEIVQSGGLTLPKNLDVKGMIDHAVAISSLDAKNLIPVSFSVSRYPGKPKSSLDRFSPSLDSQLHELADFYENEIAILNRHLGPLGDYSAYSWNDRRVEYDSLAAHAKQLGDFIDRFRDSVLKFLSGANTALPKPIAQLLSDVDVPRRLNDPDISENGQPAGGCLSWGEQGCSVVELRLTGIGSVAPDFKYRLPQMAPGRYRVQMTGDMKSAINCSNDNPPNGWGPGWLTYSATFSLGEQIFASFGNHRAHASTGEHFVNKTVDLAQPIVGRIEFVVHDTDGNTTCFNNGGKSNSVEPTALVLAGFSIKMSLLR